MSDPSHNINPHYKKHPPVYYTEQQCIEGIIDQNPSILSYLISKAESSIPEDLEILYKVLHEITDTGHSRVIALSGAPGVGKSTFVNSYGNHLINKGHKLAVLPVDPSSNVSRGSILGDKTRMEDIVNSDKVYIKPMPSSLSVGGVAPASFLATHICRLAKFDYIFLETVGVGQSEYEARHLSDLFILLLQPGGGDDLQGIKRGIMEMADILLVNKADGPLESPATNSLEAYKQSLKLMLPNAFGWKAKSGLYSSMSDKHIEKLDAHIESYYDFMSSENKLMDMRKSQNLNYFDKHYKEILIQNILQSNDLIDVITNLRNDIREDKLYPYIALQKLKNLALS